MLAQNINKCINHLSHKKTIAPNTEPDHLFLFSFRSALHPTPLNAATSALQDKLPIDNVHTYQVTIPSFIDSVKDELDAITFDSANNVATTDQDVTALIVQNKTSDAVVPFN